MEFYVKKTSAGLQEMVLGSTAEAMPVQEQTRDEASRSVECLVFEKRDRWASIGHVFNMRAVPGLRQG